jgi:hypothetical protein
MKSDVEEGFSQHPSRRFGSHGAKLFLASGVGPGASARRSVAASPPSVSPPPVITPRTLIPQNWPGGR